MPTLRVLKRVRNVHHVIAGDEVITLFEYRGDQGKTCALHYHKCPDCGVFFSNGTVAMTRCVKCRRIWNKDYRLKYDRQRFWRIQNQNRKGIKTWRYYNGGRAKTCGVFYHECLICGKFFCDGKPNTKCCPGQCRQLRKNQQDQERYRSGITLFTDNTSLQTSDIPEELLALARLHLELKKEIRETYGRTSRIPQHGRSKSYLVRRNSQDTE